MKTAHCDVKGCDNTAEVPKHSNLPYDWKSLAINGLPRDSTAKASIDVCTECLPKIFPEYKAGEAPTAEEELLDLLEAYIHDKVSDAIADH